MNKPNVTHLKDDIDKGRTGDKNPGFDPAAAPLGTDEEAGGFSATTAEIVQARDAENRGIANESAKGSAGAPHNLRKWWPLVVLLLLVIMLAVVKR